MKGFFSGLCGLMVTVALVNGCSSDEDGGGGAAASCKSDPLTCGSGKTCWPVDGSGAHACLEAKPGAQAGDACQNLIGQAQCGAGQYCFPSGPNSPTGTCSPFCVNGSCSNGSQCYQITLVGAADQTPVLVCQPLAAADAGTDSGSDAMATGGAGGMATGGSGGMATGGSGGVATGGSGGMATGGSGGMGSGGMAAGGAPADAGSD